nr:NADH dehydrogenase subunit 6 [Hydroides norvegica]
MLSEFASISFLVVLIAFSFETPVLLAVCVFSTSAMVTFSYVWGRSTWFGLMVWLVYLSALLVMFLFFVSLAPNPSFAFKGGWETKLAIFSVSLFVSCLVCGSSVSNGGFEWEGLCMPMAVLWSEGGAIFMAGLAAYLFFAVVIVSKLGARGGGALRVSG